MDSRGLLFVRSVMRTREFSGFRWSCFFIFCDMSTPVEHYLTRKHRDEREISCAQVSQQRAFKGTRAFF
jgi:hypothetical protein